MIPGKIIRCFFLLLLLIPAACRPVLPTPGLPIRLGEIDAYLTHLTQAQDFSGAVLIAQDGKVLFSQGYGLADVERGISITSKTRFHIASITKTFTAASILMLQAQGKLHVQDSICLYIDDCPAAWRRITIQHLLTHTSGIPNFLALPGIADKLATPAAPAQVMDWFKDLPLNFQPGKNIQYSNSGYVLLGVIIERLSGQTYDEFLQQNIFNPLGMADSGFDPGRSDLAIGYKGYGMKADPIAMSVPFSAGGLYSSLEDLYRWDQALYTDEILPQSAREKMLSPQAGMSFPSGNGYGYGWFVGGMAGQRCVFHAGSLNGFQTYLMRFPEQRITLIILSNREDTPMETIRSTLLQKFFSVSAEQAAGCGMER